MERRRGKGKILMGEQLEVYGRGHALMTPNFGACICKLVINLLLSKLYDVVVDTNQGFAQDSIRLQARLDPLFRAPHLSGASE